MAHCIRGSNLRVLRTGSSGWLGRFLAPRLRAAGHHVIGLDVAQGAETHVIGSVADRTVVERTFSDHQIIRSMQSYMPALVTSLTFAALLPCTLSK
jgi:nucleoside-diphosphate-sugar epimerase